MKEQDHKRIHIKDLVLWTENPRDPISPNASNQEIVNRAIESEKWKLRTLVKEMGDSFDESELPTVVYHGDKPIVYDGNRRMIVAKIAHNLVEINPFQKYGVKLPTFPTYIPCNVCTPERAIQNIYRKHDKTGSWLPLERDIFRHKHMKEPKSIFLLLEENTGIIRANEKMVNQRFIKEEVFTKSILEKLGLSFQGEQLMSKHTKQQTYALLQDIVDRIVNKEITTRNNRGEIIKLLSSASKQLLRENKNREPIHYNTKFKTSLKDLNKKKKNRPSPRISAGLPKIFGKELSLEKGAVNNLYKDICDLYYFCFNKKNNLSDLSPSFIRLALRLLCEMAGKEKYLRIEVNQPMKKWINKHFESAKKNLTNEQIKTLDTKGITPETLIKRLHRGAHEETTYYDLNDTIAMSIIIGAMLEETHPKK